MTKTNSRATRTVRASARLDALRAAENSEAATAKLLRVNQLLPRMADPEQGAAMTQLIISELGSSANGIAPINVAIEARVLKSLKSDSLAYRTNAIHLLESIIRGQGSAVSPADFKTYLGMGKEVVHVTTELVLDLMHSIGKLNEALAASMPPVQRLQIQYRSTKPRRLRIGHK